MAKNKQPDFSYYDFTARLLNIVEKMSITVWREEIFGETDFSAVGNPEDYKRVKEIAGYALARIDKGKEIKETADFIFNTMFPNIDIPKLIKAVKENKLKYQNYETLMMVQNIEEIIPDYLHRYKEGK
jgi:hypothetical protein